MFANATSTAPRLAESAHAQGAYELAVLMRSPVIDPGGEALVDLFITGYGSIRGAKLQFYPSADVFDLSASVVTSGLYQAEDGKLLFGRSADKLDGIGTQHTLGGLKAPKWDHQTLFFDVQQIEGDAPPQILTETTQGHAPFEYKLTTRKDVRPGKYTLEFFLTYYDGKAWRVNHKKTEFQVRNFLERNQVFIGTLACISTVVALVRFAVLPLVVAATCAVWPDTAVRLGAQIGAQVCR